MTPRLRYAGISTGVGGIAFALFADMSRFPGGWIGYGVFLVGVFVLALYLFDKLD